MQFKPLRFIQESINVSFERQEYITKRPSCPNSFVWRGDKYKIVELLMEWHDYERKGRYKRNMQLKHAKMALLRGSWGVGLYFFIVRTGAGQIFEIYYDRSSANVDDRIGKWFLYRELSPDSN